MRLLLAIDRVYWVKFCRGAVAVTLGATAIAVTGCAARHDTAEVANLTVGSIPGSTKRSDLQIAQANFERQAYGLAEKHFRLAIEESRTNADAWLGLAASYDQLKRFDLADRAYDQVRSLTGESAVLLNNMGYSHTLRGNFRKAATLLERAQRIAPDDERVLENISFLENRRAGKI